MSNGKKPSVEERLQQLGSAPSEPESESEPTQAGWLPDPWKHVMQSITPPLDRAGLLGDKAGYLRQLGGAIIPQNTTQAGLAAMLALQPETALSEVPVLGKLAAPGVKAALSRAALRGLATGGIAKATGSGSAVESGAMGALGSLGGEAIGKAVTAYSQSAAAKLAMSNVTNDLAQSFRETIGQWLPKPKTGAPAYSAERVIRAVWNGEASNAVGAELSAIKAAHVHTAVPIVDLVPKMRESGVVFELPTTRALSPGDVAGTRLPPGGQKALRPGEPASPLWTDPGPEAGKPLYPLPPRPEGARTGMEIARRDVSPSEALAIRKMPLGEALERIERARSELQTYTGPDKAYRLAQLQGFEDVLTIRAEPRYEDVLKQYGRTKQLQDWLNIEAPSLFDGRTGRISWDGYAKLAQRLGRREANAGLLSLKSFSPEEIAGFGQALRLDLDRGGMVWGQEGRYPVRGMSVGMTGMPHAYGIGAPRADWMPGLKAPTLVPGLARAIAGQAPVHLAQPPDQGATE